MTTNKSLSKVIPAIKASENGLGRYMETIKTFPLLKPAEEQELARAWAETGDAKAAERLIKSHLRLVAKIAMGFRHYGLPVSDLISEGNVGLLRAVNKFDAEKGFRLSTYAMWWIKASITEYVLNQWSLVKLGGMAAQKKLFFNLSRTKAKLGMLESGTLSPEQVTAISEELGVPEKDVIDMNGRLSGRDASLNVPVLDDSESERQDFLRDQTDLEEVLAEQSEKRYGRTLLKQGLGALNDREKQIITARRLSDDPVTLETLGERFGISRERVRQIENRAFQKLQTAVLAAAANGNEATAAA